MRSSLKRAGILAGVAAVAWAGIATQSPHRDSSRSSRDPASVAAVFEGASADRALPTFDVRSGTRLSYGFTRWLKIDGLESNPVELRYSGRFDVQVLGGTKESSWDLLFSESVDGQESGAAFRARMSADGRILGLRGERAGDEAASEHQSILKDLIAEWSIFENTDTTAPYEANLRVLSDGLGRVKLEKRKISYSAAVPNRPEILESRHRIDWSRQAGAPEALQENEITATGPERSWKTASAFEIRLRETTQTSVTPVALRALDQDDSLRLSNQKFAPDLAISGFDDLAGELENVSASGSKDQLRVFGHLLQALKAKPEFAKRVAEAASAAGSGSEAFRVAVGALAGAGTPAAQAALRQLYDDASSNPHGRQTILAALTTAEAPIEAPTRDFLIRVSRSGEPDLAQSAGFALGSSLAHSGDDAAVKSELFRSLQSAQTDAEKGAALDSIGNSGNLAFFPTLKQIRDSENSGALRGKAVFAARFMSGTEVEQWLRSGASDPDPRVQQAAAETLKFRGERQQ